TVYLAGLGLPGTHNSGVALVQVTQANGPRLIVNNEEERFSGNKHTTEYPRVSIDEMVAVLRSMGRDIGDIDAWLTSWVYTTRSVSARSRSTPSRAARCGSSTATTACSIHLACSTACSPQPRAAGPGSPAKAATWALPHGAT